MNSSTEDAPPLPDVPAHWGGFTLGGMAYAVPLAHLREALPAGRLSVWPGTAACVVGAVERRGLLLPVVDLRRLAGSSPGSGPDPAAPDAAPPLVVVIAHDGHLLGLCADAVTGLFQAPSEALQAVTLADGAEPCVLGALMRPDRDELVSVLNPRALMALPQVPRSRDPSRGASHLTSDPDPAGVTHWLLVQAGDARLAIDSARVRMAVPLDGLRPSVLSRLPGHADCLGEWPHPQQPVVVIDPLIRTGLGALAEGQARQALLLDTDAGLLGLAIGAVLDVRRLAASAVLPLPAGRVAQPAWFAGVLGGDGQDLPDAAQAANPSASPVLALDAAHWSSHPDLTGMASLHGQPAPAGRARHAVRDSAARDPAARNPSPPRLTLLTYGLPAEVGTPLDQIDEVLPWQADRPGLDDEGQSPWLGIVMQRGRPVTLLCLRRWSGATPAPIEAGASILVVRHGAHRIGCVVPRLLAIEPAGWQPPVVGALRHRQPGPLRASRLAQIHPPGGQSRLIPVLDLLALAARAAPLAQPAVA